MKPAISSQLKSFNPDKNRRKVHSTPTWLDYYKVEKALHDGKLPDALAAIRRNKSGLSMMLDFLRKNTFKFIETAEGERIKMVDVSESKWVTQENLAEKNYCNVRTIRRAEDFPVFKKIVVQEGLRKRRYLAFSSATITWLKEHCAVKTSMICHEDKLSGSNRTKWVHKNKPPENRKNKTIYDDDSKYSGRAGTDPHHHKSEDLGLCQSAQQPQAGDTEVKVDSWELTDAMPVAGHKPWQRMNTFWAKQVNEYGYLACRRLVIKLQGQGQRIKWNAATRKAIKQELAEAIKPVQIGIAPDLAEKGVTDHFGQPDDYDPRGI